MSTDHNFRREKRAEADSNRGPSAAYQPNALPLGQKKKRLTFVSQKEVGEKASRNASVCVCVHEAYRRKMVGWSDSNPSPSHSGYVTAVRLSAVPVTDEAD